MERITRKRGSGRAQERERISASGVIPRDIRGSERATIAGSIRRHKTKERGRADKEERKGRKERRQLRERVSSFTNWWRRRNPGQQPPFVIGG